MGPTSGVVLFAVIWFMVFFIVLPLRLKTQGDVGEIVPGTHAGSPAEFNLRGKVIVVSAISIVLWLVIAGVIISGWIGIRDIDIFNRMAPVATDGTGG
jgi:predicted secreted protein